VAVKRVLLRVFMTEGDKLGGEPAFKVFVEKARELGLEGCTVFKGVVGVGRSGKVHSKKLLGGDEPLVVECVDEREKLKPLISLAEEGDFFFTLEEVELLK